MMDSNDGNGDNDVHPEVVDLLDSDDDDDDDDDMIMIAYTRLALGRSRLARASTGLLENVQQRLARVAIVEWL